MKRAAMQSHSPSEPALGASGPDSAGRTEERRRAERERRREKEIDRVAFFSDAIFAIAITLLVLRISIPALGEDLGQALLDRWSSFLMFVISFWVIGQYWLVHHRMFRYIRGYDHTLIMLDLFLMMCIAFLPYPTELLGRHSDEPLAVVMYAASVFVTGLTTTGLWWYAAHRGFLDDELTGRQVTYFIRRGLLIQSVFLISIPLAFVDTSVAMFFWLTLALLRPIDRLLRRRAGFDDRTV